MRLIGKFFSLVFILSFFVSCAHHRSGRYVFQNGSWQFESSKTGFMNYLGNPGTYVDYDGEGKFLWPVPSSKKITSFYGPRGSRFHDGIDIKARSGASIIAVEDGVVSFSGRMRGYGNIVIVKHGDKYHSVYAHNKRNFVKKGSRVSQGEVIAAVGSSGRSTGPHLHFEIRKHNRNYNPLAYYSKLRKYVAGNN